MSSPQSNSTHTIEKPVVEVERTRLTPDAPFTAVSIGKVMRRSTSSGAKPAASVITTTVGALRSGKTSTSMLRAVYMPAIRSNSAPRIMENRLSSEKRIILFSMVVVLCLVCVGVAFGYYVAERCLF